MPHFIHEPIGIAIKDTQQKINVQWCQIENQQSPVYVVDSHFSRHPDGCLECCHNLT